MTMVPSNSKHQMSCAFGEVNKSTQSSKSFNFYQLSSVHPVRNQTQDASTQSGSALWKDRYQAHNVQVDHSYTDFLSESPRPLRVIPPGTISEGGTLPSASANDKNEEGFSVPTPQIGYLRPHADEESKNMEMTGDKQIIAQITDEDIYNIIQPNSAPIVDLPVTPSTSSYPNARNRLRRAKISEGMRALKESYSNPGKGNNESLLDDVIDYIKFLKFQVKALSQSRLGGEATPYPIFHLEGFGHYLAHQQVPSEPMEEVTEQLMELSMPAAIHFLERKGLAILPMALADTLLQPNEKN